MLISSFQALCLLPEPDAQGVYHGYCAIKWGDDRAEANCGFTVERLDELATKYSTVLFGRCSNRKNAGCFIIFGRTFWIKADTKKANAMLKQLKLAVDMIYGVAPTRKAIRLKARAEQEAYWRDVRAAKGLEGAQARQV